jgi:3'-5' exoribonuclease
MHDIGKIEELSSPVLPEYTAAGNLLGHISMMNTMIDRVAHELSVQDSESIMLLKHMVLSHHGKMEYGSPVLPMTPEAEVLATIDNLDARLFMMKDSLDQTLPGAFGPRVFALENRMIYKRKKEDK